MLHPERRREPRAFFTLDEALAVTFARTTEGPDAHPALLLSLSRGGIGFVTAQTHTRGLNLGDKLVLSLQGLPGLIPGETAAFIRHIAPQEMSGKAGIGLEWAYLPPATEKAIAALIVRRAGL